METFGYIVLNLQYHYLQIIIVEGCCHFFGASRDTCDDVVKCGPFSIKVWLHRSVS